MEKNKLNLDLDVVNDCADFIGIIDESKADELRTWVNDIIQEVDNFVDEYDELEERFDKMDSAMDDIEYEIKRARE